MGTVKIPTVVIGIGHVGIFTLEKSPKATVGEELDSITSRGPPKVQRTQMQRVLVRLLEVRQDPQGGQDKTRCGQPPPWSLR